MLLRVGIYSIFLIMMLVKCILPDEKPEIIPLPQQSVLDKGDFIFDPTTLISVENEKQAMIARELTGIFNQAAGFSPQIAIQEKQADIIFRTDMSLSAEHYKLNISPSCILVEASGNKGFFYAIQTLRFLLPPAINSQTPVKNIQWNVPGMTIHDGPRYNNRTIVLHTPFNLIPKNNLEQLIDCMAMLKINRLHFIQELNITPEIQQGVENMTLYARSKKITISTGMIRSDGITFNLPFHVEQIIRQSNIYESDNDKKQLFQYLASIAEKSWSNTQETNDDKKFNERYEMMALYIGNNTL
ncbi:glycoside hydrolase family 20 zincin-like fold domain-containing protein [Parabacteroides gordonii]|uniref:glycoside hydrolase family 20 zincin-like fold domain-containing protein n=1 Tax=Parabacteroides gordonii TaxID=574930 RepID=UPI0026EC9095|nr:glycoside hydrolase family 20 zincin-like fold domain-containing protein [Parabacteroides gordonii]